MMANKMVLAEKSSNDPRSAHNAALEDGLGLDSAGVRRSSRTSSSVEDMMESFESVLKTFQLLHEAHQRATPTRTDKILPSDAQSPQSSFRSPARVSRSSTPINRSYPLDSAIEDDLESDSDMQIQPPLLPPPIADTVYVRYNMAVILYQRGKFREAACHLEPICQPAVMEAVDGNLCKRFCVLLAESKLALKDYTGMMNAIGVLETMVRNSASSMLGLNRAKSPVLSNKDRDTDDRPVALDELMSLTGIRSSTPQPDSPKRPPSTQKNYPSTISPMRGQKTPSPSRTYEDDFEIAGANSESWEEPHLKLAETTSLSQYDELYLQLLKLRGLLLVGQVDIAEDELQVAWAKFRETAKDTVEVRSDTDSSMNDLNMSLLRASLSLIDASIQNLRGFRDKSIERLKNVITSVDHAVPDTIISTETQTCALANLGNIASQMGYHGVADGLYRQAVETNMCKIRKLMQRDLEWLQLSDRSMVAHSCLRDLFDSSKSIKFNAGLHRLAMLGNDEFADTFVDPLCEDVQTDSYLDSISLALQWFRGGEALLRQVSSIKANQKSSMSKTPIRCGKHIIVMPPKESSHKSSKQPNSESLSDVSIYFLNALAALDNNKPNVSIPIPKRFQLLEIRTASFLNLCYISLTERDGQKAEMYISKIFAMLDAMKALGDLNIVLDNSATSRIAQMGLVQARLSSSFVTDPVE
ncbi:hypothetical protein HDV05_001372 [Chytridiales sp. JEL 0842]|nr:hypothetical protein HDV05_001372 [Chytridiales sp. JEL 0842]